MASVKIDRTGSLCLYILFSFGALSAGPQQPPAPTQSAAPADPGASGQNPTTQNPAAQTPPAQNPTTQNPPAQTPPSQNPTTQNPTTQTPPAQTPAQTSPDQPPSTAPIVVAPPELPKYPDVRLPGEYGFYIGIDGWTPKEQPIGGIIAACRHSARGFGTSLVLVQDS